MGDDLIRQIAQFANGDARTALSTLEMVVLNGEVQGEKTVITPDLLAQCTSQKSLLYDKNGEEHYNIISALHKSMRNSVQEPGKLPLQPTRPAISSVCLNVPYT